MAAPQWIILKFIFYPRAQKWFLNTSCAIYWHGYGSLSFKHVSMDDTSWYQANKWNRQNMSLENFFLIYFEIQKQGLKLFWILTFPFRGPSSPTLSNLAWLAKMGSATWLLTQKKCRKLTSIFDGNIPMIRNLHDVPVNQQSLFGPSGWN